MLLESIIKKTLGLKGHNVKKVERSSVDTLTAYIEPRKGSRPTCSVCKKKAPGYDSLKERVWKHVPLWGIEVNLVYTPRRCSCPCCGVKVEHMPWALGKSRNSLPLIVVLSFYAKLLSWEEVSRLFGVHWNTVKSAVSYTVEYGLLNRDLSDMIYIGIDEISRRKGHTYVTNVYDLAKKRLIWTGEGRDRSVLDRFFAEIGDEALKQIKCICCDMWSPYIEGVKANAPHAVLVFDKFHIVRHLTGAVDKVRKEEVKEKKKDNPGLLKGAKYIYLKNPWNLTPKQKARLGALEKLNLKINRAYLLKENFRLFWDYSSPVWAKKYLKKWFWWATHSRLKPMRDFAWMLRRHEDGLLNYFKYRITGGTVEGLNRKAKVLSQRAYGYRTFKTFKLALYHVMGDMPVPEITHKFV